MVIHFFDTFEYSDLIVDSGSVGFLFLVFIKLFNVLSYLLNK